MTIRVAKQRINSLGLETTVPFQDWIDLGIYATDSAGNDELIYYKKHTITEVRTTMEIIMDCLPTKAHINPRYSLMDKNTEAYVVKIE